MGRGIDLSKPFPCQCLHLIQVVIIGTKNNMQIGRALAAGGRKAPLIFDIVMNIENLCSIGAVEEELGESLSFLPPSPGRPFFVWQPTHQGSSRPGWHILLGSQGFHVLYNIPPPSYTSHPTKRRASHLIARTVSGSPVSHRLPGNAP